MKTIIKRLQKQKFVSGLKILSLGIGIACSLTLFYIAFLQLNTDGFYKDKDQIYQVFVDVKTPNLEDTYSNVYQPIAGAMMNDLPQVQYGTTVRDMWKVPFVFENQILEARTIYADSLFFKVFKRPFLVGNPDYALRNVNTAIVTCSYANKIFGRTDVIGKTLDMRGERIIEITGIIEDWPQNSSFEAEVIVSFETLIAENRLYMGWNGGDSFNAYLKVLTATDFRQMESNFPGFISKYVNIKNLKAKGYFINFRAIPITKAPYVIDTQLKSTILILFLLGALLLGLVVFNSMLLSISQQQRMQKELYIRRLNGSSRFHIFKLLFSDALFQFVMALLVAAFIVWLISPLVNSYYGINLIDSVFTTTFLALLAGISLILFFSVSFIPGQWAFRQISRNQRKISSKKDAFITDIPLAFQIGISFTLLLFFWFIFQQLVFIQNLDKGFNSSNLAYVELNSKKLFSSDKLLKFELRTIPGVESVALSDDVPLNGLSGNNYGVEPGGANYSNFRNFYVDRDFFSTLNIELEGRGFSRTANDEKKVIITRSVAKELGLETPLNQTIYKNGGEPFIIVGVVPDLTYGTVHSEKQGIVFDKYYEPDMYSTLTIRINAASFGETVQAIKSKINHLVPGIPVQIKYYDAELMASYEYDYAIKKTVSFFAVIAALLTIAGLVGFSISSVQKRVKEIGVRKVNGADEWSLLVLLNRGFVIKTIVALLAFTPLAWWLVITWLNNYAYHISISKIVIALLSIVVVLVVFVTISIAVWSVVTRNPVEALRYE